ncbi:acyl carrier protein [Sorangium sp. So ce131]|uniref:acyl carrier protein n=1 Tax=Sorangium sp. So ce131 TaxID=3133282 RepID=UPI003F6042DB
MFAVTPDLETVRRALHDHIVTEILLRKAPLALDEDLLAGGSGFDSMSLTRVLVFVEERFGVKIPDEEVDLDEVSTVDRMARFVAGRIAAAQG